MISKLLDAVFGCWHQRYSFPMTVRSGSAGGAQRKATYVVCLDCGKQLPYDWQAMKVVAATTDTTRAVGPLATKEAA